MNELQNFKKIVTDDTYLEISKHGSNEYPFCYYPENVWDYDLHCISWHWHHEVEFIYVESGTAYCYIGADKIELPSGSAIFINSGILHRIEAFESTYIPNIVFSPTLLGEINSRIYKKYVTPIIHSTVSYQIFHPQAEWQNKFIYELRHIFSLQSVSMENEIQTLQSILKLWELIFSHWSCTDTSVTGHYKVSQQSKLQVMLSYIHAHFHEQMTLDEIADSISVSKNNALYIFKTCMHISPIAYLIQYRLIQAAKLLSETEKKVSVIADECGFSDAGYFCRKFKEYYTLTPNRYRLKKRII